MALRKHHTLIKSFDKNAEDIPYFLIIVEISTIFHRLKEKKKERRNIYIYSFVC